MEMVAWLSGLTAPGEEITLDTLRAAIGNHLAEQTDQGYSVSDMAVYGSQAMVTQVFGGNGGGKEVEGVGEVWMTETLDPVADFQVIWQREPLAPAVPARRQRTRRR